jgi:hypothetical protein
VIARLPTGRSSADTPALAGQRSSPRTWGTPARDEERARCPAGRGRPQSPAKRARVPRRLGLPSVAPSGTERCTTDTLATTQKLVESAASSKRAPRSSRPRRSQGTSGACPVFSFIGAGASLAHAPDEGRPIARLGGWCERRARAGRRPVRALGDSAWGRRVGEAVVDGGRARKRWLSGRSRARDRVCRAYRRGHQDGADEHQDEPGDARGHLERFSSHRIAEHENAGQDR